MRARALPIAAWVSPVEGHFLGADLAALNNAFDRGADQHGSSEHGQPARALDGVVERGSSLFDRSLDVLDVEAFVSEVALEHRESPRPAVHGEPDSVRVGAGVGSHRCERYGPRVDAISPRRWVRTRFVPCPYRLCWPDVVRWATEVSDRHEIRRLAPRCTIRERFTTLRDRSCAESAGSVHGDARRRIIVRVNIAAYEQPLRFERPPWMTHAACKGMDPDLFFPAQGGPVGPARDVCRDCPVRAECLDYSLEPHGLASQGEKFGIWGGVTERERRRLRRQRRGEARRDVA